MYFCILTLTQAIIVLHSFSLSFFRSAAIACTSWGSSFLWCILNFRINTDSGVDAKQSHVVHLWDLGYDQNKKYPAVHDHINWLKICNQASHVAPTGNINKNKIYLISDKIIERR